MALNLRDFLGALGDDLIRVDDEIDPITQAGALCSASPRPIMLNRLKGFPGWKLCDVLVKDRARQAKALLTPLARRVGNRDAVEQAAILGALDPAVLGDAAHAILTRRSRDFTGQFCIDDKVLYASGVRDFEPYRVDPTVPLASDFFVPEDDVPPPGVVVQTLPSTGGVQKSR